MVNIVKKSRQVCLLHQVDAKMQPLALIPWYMLWHFNLQNKRQGGCRICVGRYSILPKRFKSALPSIEEIERELL
jgi:hypothetical protein